MAKGSNHSIAQATAGHCEGCSHGGHCHAGCRITCCRPPAHRIRGEPHPCSCGIGVFSVNASEADQNVSLHKKSIWTVSSRLAWRLKRAMCFEKNGKKLKSPHPNFRKCNNNQSNHLYSDQCGQPRTLIINLQKCVLALLKFRCS